MKQRRKPPSRFGVCVKNEGFEASLERNKIYVLISDAEAAKDGDVRVVDESGEDYLYPSSWFVPIDVPSAVKASLRKLSRKSPAKPLQPTASGRG